MAIEHTAESTQTDASAADALLVQQGSDITPVLSVVMPTLNEEAGIATCIEKVKRAVAELGVTTEIVVSDSSTDRTPEIAREMGAIVYEPDRDGYGYAYQYAFEHVRGEYIVIGDADTTYDFEAIPQLLELVTERDADIAMGSRLDGEIMPGAMPALHQYVGNPLLTKFLNVFYEAGVTDAHSGFRILTREALETLDLRTNGMEFASEMIMDAGARDMTIEELPITYHEREGDATLDSFRDGWRHVKFMLINAPGYLFSIPGLLIAAVGFLVMAFAFSGASVAGIRLGPHSMIVGSLLAIVGYQIASLGIFATIAGDPIRKPNDPLTSWIVNQMNLEHGATLGLSMFVGGGVYATYLVDQWIASGFSTLPFLLSDVVAFTAIVLGVQTVFSSFFMSALND